MVELLEEAEEFAYTIRIELERGYITEEFAKKQTRILVQRINKQLKELENGNKIRTKANHNL